MVYGKDGLRIIRDRLQIVSEFSILVKSPCDTRPALLKPAEKPQSGRK